ncbi:MAG: hypothetical protein JNG84_15280 [Archangium sp.]|nr:hypothetical protein [Archangium sp.]
MWRIVLLGLVVGCSHAPLRMRTGADDAAALKLGPVVSPVEDGRRRAPGTDEYEWWYLDGVADDGTVVVVWFGDNWLVGTHSRRVSIEVAPPGQPTRKGAYVTDDPGSFAAERADVHIGNNTFAGDLVRYRVTVDAAQAQGLGCDLTLDARVAPFRPGTGLIASGDQFFAWLAAVPEGALAGSLVIDGKTVRFEGSGYHDHNWGNVEPWALMRGWWWGRGQVGDQTVVMSELRPAEGLGDTNLPLVFIGDRSGSKVFRHAAELKLVEQPGSAHGDPAYEKGPVPQGVSLVPVGGDAAATVRFTRHGAPLTSADLLGGSSAFVRMLARIAGRSPWYSRWASEVTIEGPSGVTRGEGTLEYMEFQ